MQKSATVLIKGHSLHLRDFELKDIPHFESWQKPGLEWKKLDGPYYQSTSDNSKEMAQALQQKIQFGSPPVVRERLVIVDPRTDQMIGTVSSYWESKETNWLCIGISIFDPSYWGKGIGFQALGLWMDYLFSNRPELVRLDMRTWSGNPGMMALAKKMGFQEEARFRKARIVDGRYYDGMGYGILRSEWDDLRASTHKLLE